MKPQRKEESANESMDAYVGRRVFHLMWDRKMTQTTIATALGVQQPALSKKLRGERGWGIDELVTVASELSTTVAYLVGETDEPQPVGSGGGTNRSGSDYSSDGSITYLDDWRKSA